MMRAALFLIILLISASAEASSFSSITCDYYMEYGLTSHNEQGTFIYVANPLKVSVQSQTGEVVLTDATHLCQITRNSIQYVTNVEGDGSSDLEVIFTSQPNGDTGDGGHISLGGGSGTFTCPYLLNGAAIELSNCSIK